MRDWTWKNHSYRLNKTLKMGVLSVLTQFLSDRSQYVLVDGCRSKLVNVVSGVPQGNVFGPLFLM